jgi:hypothetical protein
LPAAYAPVLHFPAHGERPHRVGFIGGANPARERILSSLAERGLLGYVVGGPWNNSRLRTLCLAANLPAERAATLYRETAIVVNVFRDRHHFNRLNLKALAPNPRIFEALACGALVISEPREQLSQLAPELPTFTSEAEAASLIERYLVEPDELRRTQQACAARLASNSYARRLATVVDTLESKFGRPLEPVLTSFEVVNAAAREPVQMPVETESGAAPERVHKPIQTANQAPTSKPSAFGDEQWGDVGGVTRRAADGAIVIEAGTERGPGRERGLASFARMDAASLSFEVCLDPRASLVAKVHLADRTDQSSNSYHLYADRQRAYLARHNHVFRYIEPPKADWTRFRMACARGKVSVWRNEQLVCEVEDQMLAGGYAFVGAQGGGVRVRSLELATPSASVSDAAQPEAEMDELVAAATEAAPRLSIVTTVYDRVDCLRQCIASVRRLQYRNLEHLIVADHPPQDMRDRIRNLVESTADARVGLYDLKRRHNNWGIAPAAAGLRHSRGEFISFLSDDNGYEPDHFGPLLAELDRDPSIGFAYSSCRYDGRLLLCHPVPRPGRIDLGQPVFRRALFEQYFGNDLPFDMMAWDWHLVDALMRRGVRWRHVNRPSFIFRLAKYPELIVA